MMRHQKRFIHGHNQAGVKHSPEWSKAQSDGLKRAWSDPTKFQSMRQHSPEFVEMRVAKNRGAKRTPEQCARISAAKMGKPLSEEHRRKSSVTWLKGWSSMTKVQQEKNKLATSVRLTGTHGMGLGERDRPDHFRAHHWIIRSPCGVIYEFDNLLSWCRKNVHLFEPDERPLSKLPLYMRAISGFAGMQRNDKRGVTSWKGWTLVSNVEREAQSAPDLIQRKL